MSIDNGFDRPFEEFEPPQWDALRNVCRANIEYFSSHQDENGLRITAGLLAILDNVDALGPLYKEIAKIAPLFDFNENTPGNGYRSFLILVEKGILHCGSICRDLYCQKDSMLFKKNNYSKEIEACSQLIASLTTCLQHLKTLHSWSGVTSCGRKSLFPGDDHSPQELLSHAENVNQYCFYGRCLGFQYSSNMRRILTVISTSMASFSEVFYANGGYLQRFTNSVKYFLDPELRARRLVNLFQHADVSFCKSFWYINESEFFKNVITIGMPSVLINQIISIPPEELILPTNDGSTISIPIPSSHIGKKPIHVKLLSTKRRIGMVGSARAGSELLGPSESLAIHCHGGGFVSQSSQSHDIYLREWATTLDIPILCIDYSLAPEAPFPRALEDVLYSYCWALKHASTLLGSIAQKVIMIGDSAGGNLILAATQKCLELNIRKPDGLFLAYTPMLVEFVPSPSRLLCLTDPMLPFGFMMNCLKAYVKGNSNEDQRESTQDEECIKSDTESFAEVSESDLFALALSPNGDETNEEQKLASLPSDSTLNSVSSAEVDATQGTAGPEVVKDEAVSQEYIRKFVNMYKNAYFGTAAPMANGSDSEECNGTNSSKSWSFFGWSIGKQKELRELDAMGERSPIEEFAFTVPKDPLLSPYLVSDDVLKQMPPMKILTMDFDPCLDDCIMFALKLKSLGKQITLDVLHDLPHGFLNFSTVSKITHEGSLVCIKRIKELLDA
ncbi:hormone-sensitive lipase [Orussus abietinus]|uniref:hormone-sensitive lipase n=1 Tax=Orussus abietinus TaxID=222816 RepID=UPI000624F586|nr:hormone-sensitive lipase [Orussus abietinus]XP_012274426.1 hormone-sensitive lipase [Orussus abietinus]XP_012274427.1 hormone-sensitive lipase [Orussus abietinus]